MPTKNVTGLITVNRKKIKGRDAKVYCALPPSGSRARILDQTLYVSGFNATVTIVASPLAGNYVLTLAGTAHTYLAGASPTPKQIIDGLVALVNAGATGVVATNINYTTRTFSVVRGTTFTATQTSPNTNADMTVSAVTGAATAAKLATTIALLAVTTVEMQVGQSLLAEDINGFQFLATLNAIAPVGSTSLTVKPLDEAIPAGSSIEFPVYVFDLKDSGISRSYNLAAAVDYNTGSDRDGVITGGEKNISLPGNFAYKNAGGLTLSYAGDLGIEVILERRFDPPSSAFLSGEITWGAGVVTGDNDTASNEGFVERNREFAFLGKVTTIAPVPV